MSLQTLEKVARTLAAADPSRKPPARLFCLTDPDRTPDPLAVALQLPPESALIYRPFGAPDSLPIARALRSALAARRCLLLIGADETLAEAAGADGVHLPERMLAEAPAIRTRHPGWIVTAAAHSAEALRRAETAGVDAVLLSSVFESRSASAGAPLGVARLAELAAGVRTPVIALGGVNAQTAELLIGSGAAGIAAVEAFAA